MKKIKQLVLISLILMIWVTNIFAQRKSPEKVFKNVSLKIIHSKILNENRRLFVYVPKNLKSHYPVFYLLDGGMSFVFKDVLAVTKNNPHIIIGIDTRKNRNRDMNPIKISSRPKSGGAENFLKFIVEELQPFVRENYPVNDKKILCGGSASGLFTVYAMLEKPEAFFAYISASPAIGYCPVFLKNKVMKFSPDHKLEGRFLYLTYGDKERFPAAVKFIPSFGKLLKNRFKNGFNLKMERLPGKHVPRGFIKAGLNFIYK